MRTKLMLALPICFLFLMSVNPFQTLSTTSCATFQDSKIVGTYDGNEGYGYNFIITHKNDGSESTMTFQKVNDAVLKEYDLDAELFINQKFEVTYTIAKTITKDENGFDDEREIYTITHLKAL